ncbi:MAG: hypothetical protein EOO89_13960 [Pedobacter sp.]|nr:MAG: hypothetical protein EOO89_13960 [Pedobacter sp.]
MNKCRLIFLIVQLFCTSLLAAPSHAHNGVLGVYDSRFPADPDHSDGLENGDQAEGFVDADPSGILVDADRTDLLADVDQAEALDDIYYSEAFEDEQTVRIGAALHFQLLTIPFRIQQLRADELVPETMIPLNNDLRRARLTTTDKEILPPIHQILISPAIIDATSFQISASYHFSATDFHGYLFRLKPF